MPRKAFLTGVLLLVMLFRPSGETGDPQVSLMRDYREADKFFNTPNPTAETDSLALLRFQQLIGRIGQFRQAPADSLLYECWLKTGILQDVKGEIPAAKNAYLQALAAGRQTGRFPDSAFFRLFIYVGSDYYNLNNFDSANYFLLRAEQLATAYRLLPEKERLYNTFGALHFSNGNYLQARNYFSQALDLVENRKPLDLGFAQGLKANMASSYYKMGRYREALSVYREILQQKRQVGYINDGIFMNMGKAHQALGDYASAMQAFRQINAADMPGVYNEMALAFFEKGGYDSCAFYLDRLRNAPGTLNVLDKGINALYQADLLRQQRQYLPALQSLQQSIVSFSNNFRSADIFDNPQVFSGSYTYFRLFEALLSKAATFADLYGADAQVQYLDASLNTYLSALRLLGYIETSYDTDDAKFFLKKNSRSVYAEALSVCLQLHALKGKEDYLAKAYDIAERNKASVLAAGLRNRSISRQSGIDSLAIQQQRNIKYNIARIDVLSEQSPDSAVLEKLSREKAQYEIELSQLQKKLEQNDRYHQLKYRDERQQVADLLPAIGRDECVFNFFIAGDTLHLFALTRTGVNYLPVRGANALLAAVSGWSNALQETGDGRKFNGAKYSATLFDQLVKPMQTLAGEAGEWTIIPDGNFWLLPFESLPLSADGGYLVEKKTISYQFSSRFLSTDAKPEAKAGYKILGMAPFVQAAGGFAALSGSGAEVSSVTPDRYSGKMAGKQTFLSQLSNYPVIHLATHAIGDPVNPAASFIAFYPETGVPVNDYLFLEEVYGLDLQHCELMIVSACETGKGAVVSNEGVLSLGRAFAAAGCGSTINSLWKADDKATAFILSRFHDYLRKGQTKARALQQAKIDYLNSDALYKNPGYWSHLVLIGNEDALAGRSGSPWKSALLAAGIAALLVVGALTVRNRSRRVTGKQA